MAADTEFIVLCHHGQDAVRHVAVMKERKVSAAEKAIYAPRTYGTHSIPDKIGNVGGYWTAGPRKAKAS
jgi:hypothetical protein